jgi:aminoglycoside phosphotransferase (APT) family kinase protein
VLQRYAAQTDRNVDGVDWYEALACFRLGILLEGTYARACAGQADPELGERLRANAVSLFLRAADAVDARP